MEGDVINSGRPRVPAGTGGPYACRSRRYFLTHGLVAGIAAPALARAVGAPAFESPPDLTTQRTAATAGSGAAAGTGSGAVRTAGASDDRLTTDVYINGSGPYRFMVDTGAERTVIAAELATQLALPRGRNVVVEGIIRRAPAVLVEIASLRMGSLTCARLQVPALPRAMLDVDGYLGLDVLDGHRVIFDFTAATLTVTRPQGFFSALWSHHDEAVVRTLGSSGRLRASGCLVDGVRAAAFIDTGAEVSVCNQALFGQLQQQAAHRQVLQGQVLLYGVTGGSMAGLSTNVDEIRMGQLRLTYWNLVVAQLEVFDLWGLSRLPALLFGMDSLRRFERVTIDYARKELRFEVARTQGTQPLEAALAPPLLG
jgi:predicted aspartyl protease